MIKEKKISLQGNDMLPAETTRQARVEAIKQAVETGNYRVDDRTLADSLISDLLWQQLERINFFKT
jgi:anti-sigma28 factor (negative regulator of flagellin synthesis)